MLPFDQLKSDYTRLWAGATVRPEWRARIAEVVNAIVAHRPRYEAIAGAANVPWWWIGAIHQMEASGDFTTHLHNGDPLQARTIHEPKGRPIARPTDGHLFYSWEESALDSLSMKPGKGISDWSIERALYEAERYNGFGYRLNYPDVLSPYLWSGTTWYKSGKYVADHVFKASVVSKQVGFAAILLGLIAAGIDLGFGAPVTPASGLAPVLPAETDMKPYEIEAVQRGLASLNYGVGKIDGIKGRLFVQAVSGFQHDHGLDVTGDWSPECANALAAALASGKTASVAETRVTARAADVHAAGVTTIGQAQKLVYGGATVFVGSLAKAVTDGNGNISIDKANDALDKVKAARGWLDAATGVVTDFWGWMVAHPVLAVGGIGLAVVFYGGKIANDAITAYREGRVS